MTQPADPNQPVITNQKEAAEAIVRAFVDGDPATSQHIVDVLGDRKSKR
jgi:hypothetical protein